ncbi:hypothetical protein V5799_006137, partial [Amblyomma americanum]
SRTRRPSLRGCNNSAGRAIERSCSVCCRRKGSITSGLASFVEFTHAFLHCSNDKRRKTLRVLQHLPRAFNPFCSTCVQAVQIKKSR